MIIPYAHESYPNIFIVLLYVILYSCTYMMIYLHQSSLTSVPLQDLAAPCLLIPCCGQLPEPESDWLVDKFVV